MRSPRNGTTGMNKKGPTGLTRRPAINRSQLGQLEQLEKEQMTKKTIGKSVFGKPKR